MRWVVNIAWEGDVGSAYRSLAWKTVCKKSLRRRSLRFGDKFKMDLNDSGLEVVGRIHLAPYRVQWRAVLEKYMNFVSS
jgi:hypothetical protein